jgi:anti-anti-sigma regulatory factor
VPRCLSLAQSEIDVANAAAFERDLRGLDPSDDVLLDMSGVTFCDVSALSALERARRRHDRAGGSLHLASVPETLRLLLVLFDGSRLMASPVVSDPRAAVSTPRRPVPNEVVEGRRTG